MQNSYQKTVTAAVFIIIGFAAGFWFGRRDQKPEQARPGDMSAAQLQALFDGDKNPFARQNAIAVNDQAPGLTVAVNMVTLGRDGWVTVRDDSGGVPGRILGARRFDAGKGMSGEVELLRPTEEGKVYFAVLHDEDGDKSFDHTKDLPVKDQQGNMILARFVAAAK